MGLAPIMKFGVTKIIATTLQAISGAGYPGVPSMDIMGNVVPYIGNEEEKMQEETQKILGTFAGDHIEPLAATVSAHCNRVPVVDGHTVTVSVQFNSAQPTEADLLNAIATLQRPAAGSQSAQRSKGAGPVHDRERPSSASQGC